MSIESPESYGETYWSSWMKARKFQDEQDGEDFIQYIPDMFKDSGMRGLLPAEFLHKWDALIASPSVKLGSLGSAFLLETADNIVNRLLGKSLQKFDYWAAGNFTDAQMKSDTAMRLARRKRVSVDFLNQRFRNEAVGPAEADVWYADSAPAIGIPDWIRWSRYNGDGVDIWGPLFEHIDLDPKDFPIWRWLSESQFTLDQITSLFNRGIMNDDWRDDQLNRMGWSTDKHDLLKELSWTIPNAMILMQGDLMTGASDKAILSDLGHADLHPDYQQKYYDAVRTKPATTDLIQWHLRQDDDMRSLDDDLRKVGIHPDYYDLYHTLAEPIPPIADLITMAVREAFSPDVAIRFGQYEDFPEPFADYARQKGMTEEWAKRYWAAHWNLPSPQQGFAMLHRGVIT